ncbi:MAG: penicillin acylase family protein [Actinobacteria bacterium]|nr:penicillin acylase family protein [Actinomycetota bacterium]
MARPTQRLLRTAFRATLGARLPITDGVLTVNGARAPVTIRRDGWGVPHVTAASAEDVWFGAGFAMGQDRSFQLELYKRLAAGELSELVGAGGIGWDRLARRIGFHHVAREQLDHLGDEERTVVTAYAAGVTAGATRGVPKPAHEFTLLRRAPTPHRPVDVLATIKFLSFLLAGNWESELARLRVLLADGPDALAVVDPGRDPQLPVTSPPGTALGEVIDHLSHDVEHVVGALAGAASNNWAVAGSRTSSGRPLLANDPHLPPLLPNLWYLLHLRSSEWTVAGASLVGTVGFGAAHNGHGAWGATAAHTDNTDLFIEEVGPDGRSVRGPDGWTPCTVREEVIEVRGGEPVIESVLETPRGPIVSPALEGIDVALSMAATWRAPRAAPGVLALPRARTFDDFRAAVRSWPAFQLNLAWADTSGTIGWQLVGDLPVRRRGYHTVPLPAWEANVGWEDDLLDPEQLPHVRDPDDGWVATANNEPVGAAHTAFLGADFLDGYRVAAIGELLQARDDWDVASTLAAQTDVRSLPWREIRESVLAAPRDDPDVAYVLGLLERWDGRVTADSSAATVFELLVAELAVRIVRVKAPRSADAMLGEPFTAITDHSILALRRVSHLSRLLRTQPDGWFDAPWSDLIADALRHVVHRLRTEHPDDWRWGHVRPLHLRHLVSEEAGPLRPIFDRGPYTVGGDAHTIPQNGSSPLDPTGPTLAIPSLRMVVDVGDWEESRWVLAGGQSGNPLSPHYDDQLEEWLSGRAIAIPWSEEAVARATTATLRLLPEADA